MLDSLTPEVTAFLTALRTNPKHKKAVLLFLFLTIMVLAVVDKFVICVTIVSSSRLLYKEEDGR